MAADRAGIKICHAPWHEQLLKKSHMTTKQQKTAVSLNESNTSVEFVREYLIL